MHTPVEEGVRISAEGTVRLHGDTQNRSEYMYTPIYPAQPALAIPYRAGRQPHFESGVLDRPFKALASPDNTIFG